MAIPIGLFHYLIRRRVTGSGFKGQAISMRLGAYRGACLLRHGTAFLRART